MKYKVQFLYNAHIITSDFSIPCLRDEFQFCNGDKIPKPSPERDFWRIRLMSKNFYDYDDHLIENILKERAGFLFNYFERYARNELTEKELNKPKPLDFYGPYLPVPREVKKIMKLEITVDWDVPKPQTYGLQHGNRLKRLNIKDADIIIERWKKFQKEYGIYDIRPLLGVRCGVVQRNADNDGLNFIYYRLLQQSQYENFVLYMGKDVPHLTYVQVERQIRNLCDSYCGGKYKSFSRTTMSGMELKIMFFIYDHLDDRYQIFLLIALLNGIRSHYSYFNSYRGRYRFRHIPFVYGKWSVDEDMYLLKEVISMNEEKELEEILKLASPNWWALFNKLKVRNMSSIVAHWRTLRQHICETIEGKHEKNKNQWTNEMTLKLITKIYHSEATSVETVDWKALTKEFPGFSDFGLRRKLTNLFNLRIPSSFSRYFDDRMEYLYHKVQPVYKLKVTRKYDKMDKLASVAHHIETDLAVKDFTSLSRYMTQRMNTQVEDEEEERMLITGTECQEARSDERGTDSKKVESNSNAEPPGRLSKVSESVFWQILMNRSGFASRYYLEIDDTPRELVPMENLFNQYHDSAEDEAEDMPAEMQEESAEPVIMENLVDPSCRRKKRKKKTHDNPVPVAGIELSEDLEMCDWDYASGGGQACTKRLKGRKKSKDVNRSTERERIAGDDELEQSAIVDVPRKKKHKDREWTNELLSYEVEKNYERKKSKKHREEELGAENGENNKDQSINDQNYVIQNKKKKRKKKEQTEQVDHLVDQEIETFSSYSGLLNSIEDTELPIEVPQTMEKEKKKKKEKSRKERKEEDNNDKRSKKRKMKERIAGDDELEQSAIVDVPRKKKHKGREWTNELLSYEVEKNYERTKSKKHREEELGAENGENNKDQSINDQNYVIQKKKKKRKKKEQTEQVDHLVDQEIETFSSYSGLLNSIEDTELPIEVPQTMEKEKKKKKEKSRKERKEEDNNDKRSKKRKMKERIAGDDELEQSAIVDVPRKKKHKGREWTNELLSYEVEKNYERTKSKKHREEELGAENGENNKDQSINDQNYVIQKKKKKRKKKEQTEQVDHLVDQEIETFSSYSGLLNSIEDTELPIEVPQTMEKEKKKKKEKSRKERKEEDNNDKRSKKRKMKERIAGDDELEQSAIVDVPRKKKHKGREWTNELLSYEVEKNYERTKSKKHREEELGAENGENNKDQSINDQNYVIQKKKKKRKKKEQTEQVDHLVDQEIETFSSYSGLLNSIEDTELPIEVPQTMEKEKKKKKEKSRKERKEEDNNDKRSKKRKMKERIAGDDELEQSAIVDVPRKKKHKGREWTNELLSYEVEKNYERTKSKKHREEELGAENGENNKDQSINDQNYVIQKKKKKRKKKKQTEQVDHLVDEEIETFSSYSGLLNSIEDTKLPIEVEMSRAANEPPASHF